jgi:hypothetical protein
MCKKIPNKKGANFREESGSGQIINVVEFDPKIKRVYLHSGKALVIFILYNSFNGLTHMLKFYVTFCKYCDTPIT